jgi:DNA-binding SARP family transcriptional activator
MALALDRTLHIASDTSVRLLGGFGVESLGRAVSLPTDSQRVVAFLALHNGPVPRAYVAGNLWYDSNEDRAYGNLRSALWRLRKHTTNLIDTHNHTLTLTATTDIQTTTDTATRLCSQQTCTDTDLTIAPFTHELLPGWYDEFVLVERERLRQTSLHALEAIAGRLTQQRRYAQAISAALCAVRLDPLRESAHRAAIAVHIAEGNHSEAIRQYTTYTTLLHTQLGLTPSPQIENLINPTR